MPFDKPQIQLHTTAVCSISRPPFFVPFKSQLSAFVKHYLKWTDRFIPHFIQYNTVTRLRETQAKNKRRERGWIWERMLITALTTRRKSCICRNASGTLLIEILKFITSFGVGWNKAMMFGTDAPITSSKQEKRTVRFNGHYLLYNTDIRLRETQKQQLTTLIQLYRTSI